MNKQLTKALVLLAFYFNAAAVCAEEKIRSFEPDSLKQIIASQKGKPFVVMVWSLDCDYCEASFGALADAKRKSRLGVVTIATDRIDDTEATRLIRKKLATSGLDANAWAFGAAPPEQLRYVIDPNWRGEMPRSYWFNAGGKAAAHSGVITMDVVTKLLPSE